METPEGISEKKPSSSSPFSPFKSKKITRSSSKLTASEEIQATDPNPWSSKTPEKPVQLPRRSRNRGVALSVKEVRKIAEGLRQSEKVLSNRSDLIDEKPIESASSADRIRKSLKAAESSIKLPEKYNILGEFFDSMDSSIRLLRLKGSMSTFTNISPKVESLTDRRFTYGHLAQLKYILPEAIVTKKVLLHDERTLCMKPDLQVTLQLDAFENNGKQKTGSWHLSLRKAFRARLLDFYKAHPEGDDIPEETLPEPFNQTKQDVLLNTVNAFNNPSLPVAKPSHALPEENTAVASHLPRSFKGGFLHKFSKPEAENTHLKLSSVTLSPSVSPVLNPQLGKCSSNVKTLGPLAPSPLKPSTTTKSLAFAASPVQLSTSSAAGIQSEEMKSMEDEDCPPTEIASIQGTPAKLTSTPAKLMSITPALQTPKRCHMSPDSDSIYSPNKLLRRPSRNRSLKFDTPVKNTKDREETHEMERSSIDEDIADILPESLLESIREKERKAMEEQGAGISEAKRRQQMIACLPKLFDMMRLIFQSIKRSVITKEELIHKIISSHFDIVDRREVEEQLDLLQELVPDWIFGKVASSGDFLFCMNKLSSPESIRARLSEAK